MCIVSIVWHVREPVSSLMYNSNFWPTFHVSNAAGTMKIRKYSASAS